MNISQLKNNRSQNKIFFFTTNNNSPVKIKRFSLSNSLKSNKSESIFTNKNKKKESKVKNNNFFNNSLYNSQKYIFKCHKISPLIALLIYEKAINKLLEYIKKNWQRNHFIEIKKKYILLIAEELHIKVKNILMKLSEKDIINIDIKLFTSNENIHFKTQYNRYKNINSNIEYKFNCNSNSLFQLNKNKVKRLKLLSFNSFKNNNKSLMNSSNILIKPKKSKNIYHTEYIYKIKNESSKLKSKYKKKVERSTDYINHFKNISMINGSPLNLPKKYIDYENKRKINLKENIINKQKNCLIRNKKIINSKKNTMDANKKIENEKKKENNNSNTSFNDIKNNNEKNSLIQLNLIKENLEDNLKNMFNFSYKDFLNDERESDSTKSLYKFNNTNINQN